MKKILIKVFYFIVPKILFDFFCFLSGYRHFKTSYSQSGEDLILLKY